MNKIKLEEIIYFLPFAYSLNYFIGALGFSLSLTSLPHLSHAISLGIEGDVVSCLWRAARTRGPREY